MIEDRELLAELRRKFRYDYVTGDLVSFHTQKPITRKNTMGGYLKVHVFCRGHARGVLAHRVCWALYYGRFPKHEIDHINGDVGDNRITNLRDVPKLENSRNKKRHRSGGVSGVTFHRASRLWRVRRRKNGKETCFGWFETEAEAIAAKQEAIGKGIYD